jgi:addiction module RelE/StbE family toxin
VRVRFTPSAAAELDTILDQIGERSTQGAANVKRRIQEVVDLLSLHPEAGQRTSLAGLRRLVANPYPYLVFYQITTDEIVIHGVRHGARKPQV